MFTCPNCSSEISKLIIPSDRTIKTLVCPNCNDSNNSDNILHINEGSKELPKITSAERNMWRSRVARPDGTGVEFTNSRYATKEKLIGDNR